MTERYRRPSFGKSRSRGNVHRSRGVRRPWTVTVGAEYAADTEMLEWVCNEGASRSLVHWVGTAADERRNEVQVARQILARYVGTYDEQAPFWRSVQISGARSNVGRTVQITVENGRLVGNMDERGKQVLIATSDTEFSRTLRARRGVHRRRRLFVKHVSGNYRFARQVTRTRRAHASACACPRRLKPPLYPWSITLLGMRRDGEGDRR